MSERLERSEIWQARPASHGDCQDLWRWGSELGVNFSLKLSSFILRSTTSVTFVCTSVCSYPHLYNTACLPPISLTTRFPIRNRTNPFSLWACSDNNLYELVRLKHAGPFNPAFFSSIQHQQSFLLRTMCYIINKICNTQEDRSNDSSLLTSMKNVLYSVSLILHPQWCPICPGEAICTTLQMCAIVCIWGTFKERLLMFLSVYVFLQQLQKEGNIMLHHFFLSVTNSLTFPSPQGCEWLKAWDISVI